MSVPFRAQDAADWTGGLMASPTVVDGKVYIGGPDGFVNALDVTTGRQLWRFELYHKNMVFINNFDQNFAVVCRRDVFHRCILSQRPTHFQLLVSRSLRFMM